MKNIIFLVTCVFLLGVLEINGYQNAARVPNRGIYSRCFDSFNQIINPMSNTLKKASRLCIISANSQKRKEYAYVDSSRLKMIAEMQRFNESMSNCTGSKTSLRYTDCISDVIQTNRVKVNEISSRLDSSYDNERQIEQEKYNCIDEAVRTKETESDEAFRDLRSCLSGLSVF